MNKQFVKKKVLVSICALLIGVVLISMIFAPLAQFEQKINISANEGSSQGMASGSADLCNTGSRIGVFYHGGGDWSANFSSESDFADGTFDYTSASKSPGNIVSDLVINNAWVNLATGLSGYADEWIDITWCGDYAYAISGYDGSFKRYDRA